MNIDEAYAIAIDTVNDLEQQGIKVERTKSRSATNPAILEKYRYPERPKPEQWLNIKFCPGNKEQTDAIHQACLGLAWQGIVFDTGGGQGARDWELDWSFRLKTPGTTADHEATLSDVEGLLNDMGSGGDENPKFKD
jgi:hypothetical protein